MSLTNNKGPKAIILGCKGTKLTKDEEEFFRYTNPFGFILFSRNCESKIQIQDLVKQLRLIVKRSDIPIFIDQEGGRVVRLPTSRAGFPPAQGIIGHLAKEIGLKNCKHLAWLNGALIAYELGQLGISVNCAPVLDLQYLGQSSIIGDRSYGYDPELVSALGESFIKGSQTFGIDCVIKHLPGHGRALTDSHDDLPIVSTKINDLIRSDFFPFKKLKNVRYGMTAHVLFTDLDQSAPATLSATIISKIIRKNIGFKGILISDDISMGALKGSLRENVVNAFKAGCDIVLHCNGNLNEMLLVAESSPNLSPSILKQTKRATCNKEISYNINDLYEQFNKLINHKFSNV